MTIILGAGQVKLGGHAPQRGFGHPVAPGFGLRGRAMAPVLVVSLGDRRKPGAWFRPTRQGGQAMILTFRCTRFCIKQSMSGYPARRRLLYRFLRASKSPAPRSLHSGAHKNSVGNSAAIGSSVATHP